MVKKLRNNIKNPMEFLYLSWILFCLWGEIHRSKNLQGLVAIYADIYNIQKKKGLM